MSEDMKIDLKNKKKIFVLCTILLFVFVSIFIFINSKNGRFKVIGETIEPRGGHTATLLQDGRVLIAGGGLFHGSEIIKSAEIYDPKTNKFTRTGDMTIPRVYHSAVLLQDGRVLITGGYINGKNSLNPLKSAEIYDPKSGRFKKTNVMNHSWGNHHSIVLNDGKIFLCLNNSNLKIDSSLKTKSQDELFDPKTNEFKEINSCLTKRCPATATVLGDGNVLFASGFNIHMHTYSKPQIFDLRSGTFKYTGDMAYSRNGSTATLLDNGKVIIIGGMNRIDILESETYNPMTGTFKLSGRLNQPRHDHSSILLNNGKVLVVGGTFGHSDMQTHVNLAELYDPKADKFIKVGKTHFSMNFPSLTLLKNGNVLIMGDGLRPELYISK